MIYDNIFTSTYIWVYVCVCMRFSDPHDRVYNCPRVYYSLHVGWTRVCCMCIGTSVLLFLRVLLLLPARARHSLCVPLTSRHWPVCGKCAFRRMHWCVCGLHVCINARVCAQERNFTPEFSLSLEFSARFTSEPKNATADSNAFKFVYDSCCLSRKKCCLSQKTPQFSGVRMWKIVLEWSHGLPLRAWTAALFSQDSVLDICT